MLKVVGSFVTGLYRVVVSKPAAIGLSVVNPSASAAFAAARPSGVFVLNVVGAPVVGSYRVVVSKPASAVRDGTIRMPGFSSMILAYWPCVAIGTPF